MSGTRAAAYFGPISAQAFVDNRGDDSGVAWEKAEVEVMDSLRLKTHALGGNAVVGVEVTADPWGTCKKTGATGLVVMAVGTAARLEALF